MRLDPWTRGQGTLHTSRNGLHRVYDNCITVAYPGIFVSSPCITSGRQKYFLWCRTKVVDPGTFHLSYNRFQSKINHRSCLSLLVKLFLSPSLLVAVAGLSLAASPVATVSSAGSFALRGATVKTDGVPSWPVMA